MKKITALLLASLMTLSLVACSSSDTDSTTSTDNSSSSSSSTTTTPETDDTEESTLPTDVLIVGTEAGYPPYEFKITRDGAEEIVGFDMALAQAVADELGVELQIVDMAFDSLLIDLNLGNVDLVIAGLSPTPERAEVVELSDIYYLSSQSIVTLADTAADFSELEDYAGYTIGAQKGTIQEEFILENLPDSNLIANDKVDTLILELKAGNIEAIVMETPVAESKLTAHPDLAIAYSIPAEYFDAEGSAAAVAKGNTELLDVLNAVIARVTTDGSFDEWVAEANELQAEYLG